jgi:hypothetical protein
MDILKQADLEQLMETSREWCVSLYMPAHKVGREQQQDPIRLGNLVTRAQENLLEYGLRSPEVQALLRPVEDLLRGQRDFWQNQSDGLAIFLSGGFFKTLRLPLKFEELVVVANKFHLKPLLPLLSKDGKFYILAISMGEIRLFLGTRDTIDQVELVGVPTSMQEALWMDDPEKFTGFHTSASSPGRGGERQAMFHGHGEKPDEDKTNLLRYFQYVDAGLKDLLEEKDIPMLLAGVDYLLPIYHEANTYSGLLEEGVEGSPKELNKNELHNSAWKLVEPIFEEAQTRDVERFKHFHGQKNELASSDLKAVVKAAHFGQVETLFVPVGIQKWGRYDPQKNQVTLDIKNKPENEDLLDYAAMQTIINSGQVYAVQPEKVPGEGELAAILRYAV